MIKLSNSLCECCTVSSRPSKNWGIRCTLRKLIHIFWEGICRLKGSSGLFLQRKVCLHHFYVRTKIQHVKNGFIYRTHVTSLSMVALIKENSPVWAKKRSYISVRVNPRGLGERRLSKSRVLNQIL